MKIFRYRKPSIRRLIGLTSLKRRVRHGLGISQMQGITSKSRIRQRVLQRTGYYSPMMRVARNAWKNRLPSLLGLGRKSK